MKFIKEWSEYKPDLQKKIKDFVEINKYNLPELWDDNLSEDENIEFMIDYFTKYPDEIKSQLNIDKIKKATQNRFGSLDYSPVFQNIGGTY